VRDGVLVDPGQPEALADAISRLHRNADLRDALGRAGRRSVSRFDVNAVAAQFVSEIGKVVPAVRTNGCGISVVRTTDSVGRAASM
jgi:glycosyltransferase involved in cell wall biosynthesis